MDDGLARMSLGQKEACHTSLGYTFRLANTLLSDRQDPYDE